MRADVNVSVRKPGGEFGTRTETKNVNSVRFVMAVVEHEAKRQVELLEDGGAVAQETRLYDPDKGVTRSLRSKEDAHDYRYFPDPDLLPLELDEAFLAECNGVAARAARRQAQALRGARHHALQCQRADRRGRDRALVRRVARRRRRAQAGGELGRRRTVRSAQPARRGDREEPGDAGAGRRAARPCRRRHDQRHDRQAGVRNHARKRRGRRRRSSRAAASSRPATPARSTPRSTRSSPPTPTRSREYKAGKQALFGFFVGQTMKAMAGKANPQLVNERLRAKLGRDRRHPGFNPGPAFPLLQKEGRPRLSPG